MFFFRLIRFPNLLIVALTQVLVQYCIHLPFFKAAGISLFFDPLHLSVLILDTMLVAAGGYIVNDILDYQIDRINRPNTLIINQHITTTRAWIAYGLIHLTGLALTLVLCVHLGSPNALYLFALAVFLLWWYSYALKKRVLSGNLVVALFCAFVPGIVAFVERRNYAQLQYSDPERFQEMSFLLGGYLLFAFSSTMLREIIKDMEDLEGDALGQVRSLPIAFGLNTAKITAGFFGLMLLSVLYFWIFHQSLASQWTDLLYLSIAVAFPTIYVLYRLASAKNKSNFHHISQVTKGVMLAGLMYLLIWQM